MIKDIRLTEVPKKPLSMNPKRFILWLFMVSIVMVFAGLTSAYIVRQSEGNWLQFELPVVFWFSTAVLLVSSLTAQLAFRAGKKDNFTALGVYLGITVVLGLVFLALQLVGYGMLVDEQVLFVGNPAGSFVYLLTGVHGVHLISGLIYLLIVLARAVKHEVHSGNLLHLSLSVAYWHFLDILWVYLFVFLLINH